MSTVSQSFIFDVDLSLMDNNASASITIPASQICQNLTLIDDTSDGTSVHTPGDGGVDAQVPNYGGDGTIIPWPWCVNMDYNYDYDIDFDYVQYNPDDLFPDCASPEGIDQGMLLTHWRIVYCINILVSCTRLDWLVHKIRKLILWHLHYG